MADSYSYFKLRWQILERSKEVFPLKKSTLDIEIFKNHEKLRNLLSDVLSYIFGLESLSGFKKETHYASFLITDFLKGSGTICYPVEYYKKNSDRKWNKSGDKDYYGSIFKDHSKYEALLKSEGDKLKKKEISVAEIIEKNLNNTPLLVVRENNQFISKKIVLNGTIPEVEPITSYSKDFHQNPEMKDVFFELINSHDNLLPPEGNEAFFIYLPIELDASKKSAGSLFIVVCLEKGDSYENYLKPILELHQNIEYYLSYIFISVLQEYKSIITLRNAIITILVDSYAHNISAHSLSYLEWWFRLSDSELGEKCPIDHVMWRFLKYLQGKSAFWSGVTREKTFGGEIKNLYSVLWEDFAYNPLFLGTIAASERIFKIGIYIQLKNLDGSTILEGEFVEIDLSIVSQIAKRTKSHSVNHEEENKGNDVPQNGSIYNFVRLKEDFQKIKEKLVELKVFFPGGVVGEHAFFTILENTLRNVKHVDKNDLTDIVNDRLQLYISLTDCGKIIKVGIWLNHPVDLIDKKSDKAVIFRLKDQLDSQVIDDKGSPILGGTSQDKICASMLYNNTFQFVEEKLKMYPWIKVASSIGCGSDFLPYYNGDEEEYKRIYKKKKGIIKRYFSLWKGEYLKEINDESDLEEKNENVSRFRFVNIKNTEKYDVLFMKARSAGIIRILKNSEIEENSNENSIFYMYKDWISDWKKNDLQLYLDYGNIFFGIFYLNKTDIKIGFQCDQSKSFKEMTKKINNELGKVNIYTQNYLHSLKKNGKLFINFAHSESSKNTSPESIMDIRSHGDYAKYFFEAESINDIPKKKIREKRIGEFLEAVITQVCVFDNRLNQRITSKEKWILFDNVLGITFYEEDIDIWNNLKNGRKLKWIMKTEKEKDDQYKETPFIHEEFGGIMDKYHFLVIHLSFIEKLGYHEDDIDKFIEKEIAPNPSDIHENFIITIVTGRGRETWWKELSLKYKKFVTFRPIESLLAAIEDGIMLKDDFQVKYNLIKVLFGS